VGNVTPPSGGPIAALTREGKSTDKVIENAAVVVNAHNSIIKGSTARTGLLLRLRLFASTNVLPDTLFARVGVA
jgi:hypothetical protein